eukprot:scaffold44914_cov77-Phaeocystis_antarctica.AAC.3
MARAAAAAASYACAAKVSAVPSKADWLSSGCPGTRSAHSAGCEAGERHWRDLYLQDACELSCQLDGERVGHRCGGPVAEDPHIGPLEHATPNGLGEDGLQVYAVRDQHDDVRRGAFVVHGALVKVGVRVGIGIGIGFGVGIRVGIRVRVRVRVRVGVRVRAHLRHHAPPARLPGGRDKFLRIAAPVHVRHVQDRVVLPAEELYPNREEKRGYGTIRREDACEARVQPVAAGAGQGGA